MQTESDVRRHRAGALPECADDVYVWIAERFAGAIAAAKIGKDELSNIVQACPRATALLQKDCEAIRGMRESELCLFADRIGHTLRISHMCQIPDPCMVNIVASNGGRRPRMSLTKKPWR